MMETARVDICYRPLRAAWAIHSADTDGFRQAVRLFHTPWADAYNPIVMADRPEEAHRLIELYRADVIVAVSEAEKRRLPLRTRIAPGSRSRDRLIVKRPARSVIGYHHGRRSDLVDVDAEAGRLSRRDTKVDGGLDWNVGSQVPASAP
jgi:hypothetical protein